MMSLSTKKSLVFLMILFIFESFIQIFKLYSFLSPMSIQILPPNFRFFLSLKRQTNQQTKLIESVVCWLHEHEATPGVWLRHWVSINKGNWFSLCQMLSVANSFLVKHRTLFPLPLFLAGILSVLKLIM